jgi:ADP-heptose:LPS heptosyltransferase
MNVVLTRLDRVGDLILSTPAIASVRRSWPDAHVTIVCSRHNAVVMENNPDVDAVIVAPGEVPPEIFGRRFRGNCALAMALAPNAADHRLVGATRAAKRVGYTYVRRYATRLMARRYLTRLVLSEADPALCERIPGRVVRHEVDQVLSLIEAAGGTARYRELVVVIREVDRAAVAHVAGDGIAFHLGLRWFRSGSTPESAVELIRSLRAFGLPVIVTYGVDAIEHAAAVRQAAVADAVVGGLSFSQWAAIFEKSRVVVTVDTGATHVASATRRPTVVLFEHRYFNLSSQEWSPYRVPSVCLRKPAGESPAELLESRAAVAAAVESLLRNPVAAAPAATPLRP